MRSAAFAMAMAAIGLAFSASAASTVEIAAGETLVISDFKTMDVNGTTIITNDLITLNEGCVVKIPKAPGNAGDFFRYQIQLLGDATLDLSDYDDSATPFRLYSGVYTAAAQAGKKLSVVLPSSKVLHIGGSGTFEVYQSNKVFLSCMISKGALALPDDTLLTFCGCTVLHDFPSNVASVAYEVTSSTTTTASTSLIAAGADMFGTDEKEIVLDDFNLMAGATAINKNQTVRIRKPRYLKGCLFTRSSVWKYTIGSSMTFPNDIVMESGSCLWARGGAPTYSGKITGTGTIATQGYGQTVYLTGELDGTFTIQFGQRGGQAYLRNTAIRKPITLRFNTNDNIGADSSGTLGFHLQLRGYDSQPTYVPVKELNYTKVINNKGCSVYTYAKQTIDVGKMTGTGHASNGGVVFFDSPTGQGQLNINSLASSARMCLFTNLNVTVTNMASGISPIFDYWCTNAVNQTTLSFVNGSTAQTVVRGVAPDVLPRHVRGLAGTLRVGDGTTNPVWDFPFDQALDDPDVAGCEGSGSLAAPASGKLRLSFASSKPLPKGWWPLLTAASGGEALSESAWPVVFADGPRPENFEIVRNSTGVWLHAYGGMTVIIR